MRVREGWLLHGTIETDGHLHNFYGQQDAVLVEFWIRTSGSSC